MSAELGQSAPEGVFSFLQPIELRVAELISGANRSSSPDHAYATSTAVLMSSSKTRGRFLIELRKFSR